MMSDPEIIDTRSIEGGAEETSGTPNGQAAAAAVVAPKNGATVPRLATIAQWTIRATGPLLVTLGILFWTGRALKLLPLHMSLGIIFVIALIIIGVIATRARVRRKEAALAVALALIIPIVGMAQTRLLPGSWHWLVRVVHLLIGVAGMVVAARLGRTIRGSESQRRIVCG